MKRSIVDSVSSLLKLLGVSALLWTLAPTAARAQLEPAPTSQEAGKPDTSLLDRVSSSPLPDPRQDVLAPGSPPLTRATLDKFTAFLAWMFDVPFTNEQRRTLKDSMVSTWKSGDKAGIDSVLSTLAVQDKLSGYNAAQRSFLRAQTQPQFVDGLRRNAAKDETARWLLGIYQAAHKPLAAGNPPLTREISDALAEVICFMLNETGQGRNVVADARYRQTCAQSLIASYPKAGAAQQQSLAKMPLLWAALQVAWPQLPEEQRGKLRRQFSGVLRSLLGPSQAASGSRASSGNAALSPSERRRRSQVAYEQIMRRMQASHSAFMGMSNMMMQQHWSTMNAIGNIGNGGYRYVNPKTGAPY